VPNGVDEDFHPPSLAERGRVAREYNITAPYVIALGTIEPRKNLARLVRAFVRARREHQLPHHLIIVGKLGWGYDDVLAAIAEANLGPAIRMLGYVPRHDIPPLIGGADVLTYVSLLEGFGLPVAEGMACGAPVVTSAVASLAEVGGNAPVLVAPTDEQAIADALARVCGDEQLRVRMRTASLERARQFTWARVAEIAVAMYDWLGRTAQSRKP
jgi:glycosyltransferase involved in cell wall biosynthesis